MDTTQRLGGNELKFVVPADRTGRVREWARWRMGLEFGEAVRPTVDDGLLARPVGGLEFGASGQQLFEDGRQIVELKFTGEMPRLFKALLREIPLERSAMSKYRAATRALELAEIHA